MLSTPLSRMAAGNSARAASLTPRAEAVAEPESGAPEPWFGSALGNGGATRGCKGNEHAGGHETGGAVRDHVVSFVGGVRAEKRRNYGELRDFRDPLGPGPVRCASGACPAPPGWGGGGSRPRRRCGPDTDAAACPVRR